MEIEKKGEGESEGGEKQGEKGMLRGACKRTEGNKNTAEKGKKGGRLPPSAQRILL